MKTIREDLLRSILLMLAGLLLILSGCRSPRIVTVPEYHTRLVTRADTILVEHHTDSRETTVVRELDSAAMAAYGIRLAGLQKAWLVETDRLRSEIDHLRQFSNAATVVRDSIPVPYTVHVQVPASLSTWQKIRLHAGDLLLVGLLLLAAWFTLRRKIVVWQRRQL